MTESKEIEGKATPGAEETSNVQTANPSIAENAAQPTSAAEDVSTDKKGKKALGKKSQDETEQGPSTAGKKITPDVAQSLLEKNPALKGELAGLDKQKATEALRNMNIADLLTGLAIGGKNQKDMASYKFWSTQPVPRFDEKGQMVEGPIKVINPDEVPKQPDPLLDGFEWVTLDLTDEKQLQELYELLTNHYVEDDNAMFRFNYSRSFLDWCVLHSSVFIYTHANKLLTEILGH